MNLVEDLVLKLKSEGNELFRKEKYDEAIAKYTESLALDPKNAALYSNRSLSYLKLKRYPEALDDSIECIKIDPRWIKGHVRKMLAHQGLGNHAEVMRSAEEGFKVCSVTEGQVKRDLVRHWLTADQALHALPEGCIELPRGIVILSKIYMEILACLIQSLEGERPLTFDLMKHCLSSCADELETLLKCFGENTSVVIQEWANLLPHEIYPYYIKPAKKQQMKCQMKSRSESLVKFINEQVDPALHPILRPLFGLIVLIVLNRCNVLTECNASHHSAEIMNEALLPLFESSLLSHEDYYSMYIGRLCALLDSFVGRGSKPTDEESTEIHSYCQKLQKALKKYPRHLPEFQKDIEMAGRALSNIQQNVLPHLSLSLSPSMQRGSVVSVETAEQMVFEKPEEVKAYIMKHLKLLETVDFLTMGEVEELISMAGIFHKLGDEVEAFRVFVKGEQAFFKVFGHLLSSHTLTLDQCPALITPIRQLVLNQALLFPDVLPDVTLRWKCLFREFRLQVLRRSSKNMFEPFFQWYTSQVTTRKEIDVEGSHAALQQHLKQEEQLMESEAKHVLADQSKLNYRDLQNILDEDTLTIDYIFHAPLNEKASMLNTYCVVCQKQGKPVVYELNFESIRTHTSRLFYLLSHNSKSDKFLKEELSMLAKALFPDHLLETFKKNIKRVYLSPDFDLSKIPLDILPLTFGHHNQTPLYELFSVSLLPSMKHLISFQSEMYMAGGSPSPKSCCIIGKPNYDLKMPDETIFEQLVNTFCSYLSISPPAGPIVKELVHSQSEIDFVSFCLQNAGYDIVYLTGDKATFNNVMSLQDPLLIHISSHASGKTDHAAFRGNFFSELDSAVALAGFNTFSKKQFELLPPDCGPAQLPPLAIYSMKVRRTKLVFLSTCNSAAGESPILEAVNSLADAFLTAGVETVIATLWTVADESASTFTKFFYDKLMQPGTRPSQAISYAKAQFLSSIYCVDKDWVCPSAFVCYGIDNPLIQ